MRNLMLTIVSILIAIPLLLQGLNLNFELSKTTLVNNAVQESLNIAAADGRFSSSNINSLVDAIKSIYKLEDGDITANAATTTSTIYRTTDAGNSGMITLSITFDKKNITALGDVMGLTEDENSKTVTITRKVRSEKLI